MDIDLEDPAIAFQYSEAINNYIEIFGEHPPTIEAPIHWDSQEWLELVEDCVSEGMPMTLDYQQQGNSYE